MMRYWWALKRWKGIERRTTGDRPATPLKVWSKRALPWLTLKVTGGLTELPSASRKQTVPVTSLSALPPVRSIWTRKLSETTGGLTQVRWFCRAPVLQVPSPSWRGPMVRLPSLVALLALAIMSLAFFTAASKSARHFLAFSASCLLVRLQMPWAILAPCLSKASRNLR